MSKVARYYIMLAVIFAILAVGQTAVVIPIAPADAANLAAKYATFAHARVEPMQGVAWSTLVQGSSGHLLIIVPSGEVSVYTAKGTLMGKTMKGATKPEPGFTTEEVWLRVEHLFLWMNMNNHPSTEVQL